MILCCGEALIDMVPVAQADGASSFAPLSGGAIFNTARALGRLGVPAGLLSGVSDDLFGQQLVRDLAQSQVSTELLIRSARPTTLAFVQLTNGNAQYTFYDENSAGRMVGPTDVPTLPDEIQALFFGGISLCAEPAASVYETLALEQSQDRVLMIDPNIRANFIQDEALYRARLDRMLAAADIVKVSDEDLNWIVQADVPEAEKIATLQDNGPALVILTKGSEGAAAFVDGTEITQVPAAKVTVVDTVGAGDTFNAGFLAELHKLNALEKATIKTLSKTELDQALSYAAKVAAVTVSRAGANPPTAAEV